MKTFKKISVLVFCAMLFFSTTSCVVFVKDDNGKHKGWYKNPSNPHNPDNTNSGKHKGNSNK